MNKLLTKIAASVLGLSMAVGVGVAAGSQVSQAARTEAAGAGNDVITCAGFANYTSNSYSAANTDRTDVANTTNTSGVTYALQLYNGSTGAVRGNQSNATGNFSARNTTTQANYYISSVTLELMSGTGGTLDGSANGRSVVYFGTQAFSMSNTAPSGTAVKSNENASGVTKLTWTNTGTSNNYFILWNLKSANTPSKAKLTVTWVAKPVVTKTLDSISLDTTNVQKMFTTGDTFNFTGLITTAHYTVPATYPDATVTPTSVSTPDMSVAGEKTVTVSYTEGGVTKTATYQIQVNDPRTVSSLTVYDSELNEIEDGDVIELVASSGTSISTDVMCEVTYSPSGNDGNVTITSAVDAGFNVSTEDNETYTLTFSANGNHAITFAATEDDSFAITVTYHVSGLPNVSYVTDVIDNALTGVGTVTTYTDWSGKSDQSDAVYAGKSAGQYSTVQLRTTNSNEGVITTTSAGGVVTQIRITFNGNSSDSRRVDVYGKNTAYSSPADLFNNSNQGTLIGSATYDKNGTGETEYLIDVSSDSTKQFSFIGFRSGASALFLDSIEITWAIEQEIIDVLEYIYIDGSLTTSTYIEGQTISLDGLTVYGHYTSAGDVSLMGKPGLTISSTPETATSTSLNEITVDAEYEGKETSETYSISVGADSVTALSWGTRGYASSDYFYSGTTLGSNIDTTKWTFAPTWASGLSKPAPSFGTGADDAHVALYTTPTPTTEGTALTASYSFTNNDDGKYLVAYYKGVFSTNNIKLNVTETLNEGIIKPASGDAGWFLVTDASSLRADDTIIIAASGYDYAMSTTQNNNNRGSSEITKSGNSLTSNSDVQEFTLEAGNKSNTWSFKTDDGYIYAASSGSNYLRTEETKSDNSSFSVNITNGVASLIAQGSNTRNVMSFNYSNNPKIFSCYSAIQGSGTLALYRYSEPTDTELANSNAKVQHSVVAFAKKLLSETDSVCLSEGIKSVAELQTAWQNAYNEFVSLRNALSGDDQVLFDNYIKYAQRTPAKQENTGDSLQNALARYDRIYTRYTSSLSTQGDFLNSISGRGAAQTLGRSSGINVVGSSNVIVIITLVSLISISAFGAFLFLRKRKEQ